MNLDLLETFVIFVDSKNIFEAANKLGVSQPSVSLKLKQLQSQFSKELFSLKGKKKVLTPFGEDLYQRISPQFDSINLGVEEVVNSYEDFSNVKIRIACRRELFPMILKRITFPGTVELVPTDSKSAVELVLDGQANFAISHIVPDSHEVFAKSFYEDHVQFLAHKSVLKNKGISQFKNREFLIETPFVAYDEKLTLMSKWLEYNNIGDINLNTKFVINDWNEIVKLLDHVKGYTICPSTFVSSNPDIHSIKISEKVLPSMKFYLLQRVSSKKIFPIKDIFS